MKSQFVFAAALCLTGCGGGYGRYDPPTVSMRNVDPVKFNNDVADCTDEKKAHGFVGDGGMIGQCLERRGYEIITPRG